MAKVFCRVHDFVLDNDLRTEVSCGLSSLGRREPTVPSRLPCIYHIQPNGLEYCRPSWFVYPFDAMH